MSSAKKRAVFLDRDGTINPDSGYIANPDDFNIYPFAAEAIKMFNDNGFYVFLVTNQSGIARGIINPERLELIHLKLNEQLARENAFIDKIYVSPYYAGGDIAPYNIEHPDRKPGIGMFNRAGADYNFDTKASFMIGDRYSDILFGKRAALTTILVRTGEGDELFLRKRNELTVQPDIIVKNVAVAAKCIINISLTAYPERR